MVFGSGCRQGRSGGGRSNLPRSGQLAPACQQSRLPRRGDIFATIPRVEFAKTFPRQPVFHAQRSGTLFRRCRCGHRYRQPGGVAAEDENRKRKKSSCAKSWRCVRVPRSLYPGKLVVQAAGHPAEDVDMLNHRCRVLFNQTARGWTVERSCGTPQPSPRGLAKGGESSASPCRVEHVAQRIITVHQLAAPRSEAVVGETSVRLKMPEGVLRASTSLAAQRSSTTPRLDDA